MNKKGFTLVELLAVIAILAILVIIALPNILSMFNSAKKSAFETELKSIYTAAEEQWVSDTFTSSGTKVYAHCPTNDCGKELKINGRSNLDYYIEFDSSGNVVKYYATDGTFQFRYIGNGLKKTDIEDVEFVPELDENDKITIKKKSEFVFKVNFNGSTMEFEYSEGMTWRDFLESDYNIYDWSTSTWTSVQHWSNRDDQYSYIPDGGTGIMVTSEPYWCSNSGLMSIDNNVCLTNGGWDGDVILIDDPIIKGMTYGTTGVNAC